MRRMESFLSPKLEGQRFAGHSVPLDMLKDFAAFQEMLVEVAKWRFLEETPIVSALLVTSPLTLFYG